ncbi:MAG: hypothetical protein Q8L23_15860 [Caulobacter sp.]|nr:hypothetical protein [Caulobacter sp.]
MSDLIGRVSISKCAELLTAAGDRIDRSALSRYCDAHGLKLAKEGKSVPVDFEAVRAHRSENLQRELMSGQPVPAPAPLQLVQAQAAPSANAVIASMPEHRELKAIAVRRELRDEAREEGLLTEVAEAEAGAAEAIVEMRTAFAAIRGGTAETMVARLGLKPEHVRPIRDMLKQYDRAGQGRFAQAMARLLTEGNEETGDAVERLTALAAVSMRFRARRSRAFARALAGA